MKDDQAPAGNPVGSRWPEVGVALFLMAIAALVIADSLRIGTGWGDDGPRSGYFPFRVGLLLLFASGCVLANTLWRWRRHGSSSNPPFADTQQLRSVAAVALPMVVYVGGVAGLGLYAASLLLIGWFMRRHGRFGWATTAAVSIGVPLAFFLVFEKWFLVPLPKGPIERLFGL